MFNAILIDKLNGTHEAKFCALDESTLPKADVKVRIDYSTLNYKDGLLITGRVPLIRQFPMIPGIDLAGVVEESHHPAWKAGDKVIANGYGLGERHWGGLAQCANVSGDWLIPLPGKFTCRDAMALGTAGYAAMLCVLALERHGLKPGDGEVLVTGASGGVGSISIVLLAGLGYEVVACTGRMDEQDYFKALGVASLIDRAGLSSAGKPLQSERWAGAIDTAGSHILANTCASVRYGGAVAAVGLAQGMDFPATVMPFILRGITLYGIDSVMASHEKRMEAWGRLARDFDLNKLGLIVQEIGLSAAIDTAKALLAGKIRGRVVVDVNR